MSLLSLHVGLQPALDTAQQGGRQPALGTVQPTGLKPALGTAQPPALGGNAAAGSLGAPLGVAPPAAETHSWQLNTAAQPEHTLPPDPAGVARQTCPSAVAAGDASAAAGRAGPDAAAVPAAGAARLQQVAAVPAARAVGYCRRKPRPCLRTLHPLKLSTPAYKGWLLELSLRR